MDARQVVIMLERSFRIHHQIVTLSFLLRFFFISYVWTIATYIQVPRLIRDLVWLMDEGMSRTSSCHTVGLIGTTALSGVPTCKL